MNEQETYQELENDYMAYRVCGKWYCLDCAIVEEGSAAKLKHSVAWGHVATLHEDTVQFEQYPGEIIPLDGVQCATCGNELYPEY